MAVDHEVQTSDDVDQQLVQRFQAGDHSAFDEIVLAHERRLARLTYRLLGWSNDCEDVVQEVFVAVLSHLDGFRGESTLSTWLTMIAIKTCRSHQRRQLLWLRHRHRIAERQQGTNNDARQKQSPEDHDAVREAVRALPPKLREPIVLRYFEEMRVNDIAKSLGLSVGAVEVRLTRARRRLKEKCQGPGNT